VQLPDCREGLMARKSEYVTAFPIATLAQVSAGAATYQPPQFEVVLGATVVLIGGRKILSAYRDEV